jgi:transketolase N-terminal domain/subunit
MKNNIKLLKEKLLEYSYENNLAHIPSALSMFDYVYELFYNKLVTLDDKIVIGKPFGAQTYYVIWKELGFLDSIDNLSVAVKHDEIPFVDFSEETIGDSLGIAAGIAMTTDKLVWVNLSDACLQMGATLEAIQFIGHNKLKNILVTIDYNGSQVTGNTADIIPTDPIIEMFSGYGWDVKYDLTNFKIEDCPKVFIMKTIKGNGISRMEKDIKKWHYRKIESLTELQSLVQELQDT